MVEVYMHIVVIIVTKYRVKSLYYLYAQTLFVSGNSLVCYVPVFLERHYYIGYI